MKMVSKELIYSTFIDVDKLRIEAIRRVVTKQIKKGVPLFKVVAFLGHLKTKSTTERQNTDIDLFIDELQNSRRVGIDNV